MCTTLPFTQRKTVRQHISHFSFKKGDLERFTAILFEQTSTIGFRYQNVQRKVMTRTFETQQTSLGAVEGKENQYGNFYKINIRI